MTIIRKLTLVLSSLVAIICLLGAIALGVVNIFVASIDFYAKELMASEILIREVKIVASDVMLSVADEDRRQEVSGLIAQGDRNFQSLETIYREGAAAAQNRIDAYDRAFRLWGDYKEAINSGDMGTMITSLNALQAAINTLKEMNTSLSQAAADVIETQVGRFAQATMLIVLISLAAAISLSIYLRSNLKKGVNGLVNPIKSLGSGDLTTRFDDGRKDEFGAIGRQLDELSSSLRDSMGLILQQMQSLSDMSKGFKQTSLSFVERARDQHDRSAQVAVAMNEMALTIKEVARNADVSAQESGQTDNQAQHSIDELRNTNQTSEKLKESMGNIGSVMNELNSQVGEITSVIDIIQGIADQTNLLALNAAIEAARAGEQGRGFAVVADEVRTLATKTSESTASIVSVIEALKGKSDASTGLVSSSVEVVEGNAESIVSISNTIQGIVDHIRHIHELSTGIAAATEEQSAVAEDMNMNITQISTLTEATSEDSQNMAADMEKIDEMVGVIRSQLGRFRVNT